MNKKQKGSWGELVAAAWLLKQGYEVFANVSDVGPADLVVWRPGTIEIFPIDVTCARENPAANAANKKVYVIRKKMRVELNGGPRVLYVIDETNCIWGRDILAPLEGRGAVSKKEGEFRKYVLDHSVNDS